MLPTTPSFQDGPFDIYYVDAVHKSKRPEPGRVELLVIHHTGGTDSREYLRKPNDGRTVSAHFLVGRYPDIGIRIYKYASERNEQTYTQGYGTIGGHAGNPNEYSVSIEIEGPPHDTEVLAVAAHLAALIIQRWNPLLVRHHDIDKRKSDPTMNWDAFCKTVYQQV